MHVRVRPGRHLPAAAATAAAARMLIGRSMLAALASARRARGARAVGAAAGQRVDCGTGTTAQQSFTIWTSTWFPRKRQDLLVAREGNVSGAASIARASSAIFHHGGARAYTHIYI